MTSRYQRSNVIRVKVRIIEGTVECANGALERRAIPLNMADIQFPPFEGVEVFYVDDAKQRIGEITYYREVDVLPRVGDRILLSMHALDVKSITHDWSTRYSIPIVTLTYLYNRGY